MMTLDEARQTFKSYGLEESLVGTYGRISDPSGFCYHLTRHHVLFEISTINNRVKRNGDTSDPLWVRSLKKLKLDYLRSEIENAIECDKNRELRDRASDLEDVLL